MPSCVVGGIKFVGRISTFLSSGMIITGLGPVFDAS